MDVYKGAVLCRGAIILYWKVDLGVKRSISLYHLLIAFTQALKAFSKSIPIKEVFSLKLKDLIKLLISMELFQPISLT